MTAGLVAAVIAFCVAQQCETHDVRIERKACGAHYRAEAPINGTWQAAEARVTCTRN